ncbi:MAG: sodium:proton antiporter, partial [Caldilineaceae bacterium]|nr:sodium:proton antiporter [Caldilineaceae bacterium]
MLHHPLVAMGSVVAAGFFCLWFAWRIRVPAILPLLFTGFIAGPLFGLIDPEELLGDLFTPFVSISVAIILFEGALTLTWKEVRNVAHTVRNLLTVGTAVTWFGGALAANALLGLSWELALLFGALIIVTGPTVIAPLLRNVRPTAKVASILKWEGIIIDPIGALIAVVVFELIVAGAGHSWQAVAISFLQMVGVGTVLGLGAGGFVYVALHRYLVPDYLRDIMVLSVVIVAFVISDQLAHESGLFTVTVMGISLANTDLRKLHEVLYFKEKISLLLIATLFILLAANVTMADLAMLDWRSLVLLAVIMVVIRPVGVFLSSLGSSLSRNERLFLAWIAPRGIVAASVSSLFAFRLVDFGVEEARILAPLVFLVIVGTVLLQGITAKPLARRLGVSEADPQGFLIMGANLFARDLGCVLKQAGFTVRLVDVNRNHVTEARLRGLDAIQGNILSEHLETDLDLSGIGRLLAVTDNDEANALACQHFEDEFGSSGVYQLPPRLTGREQSAPSLPNLGRLLFSKGATYGQLQRLLDSGATIKATAITEVFNWEDFRRTYGADALLLMSVRRKRVTVASVDAPMMPQPGWTAISLVKNG